MTTKSLPLIVTLSPKLVMTTCTLALSNVVMEQGR